MVKNEMRPATRFICLAAVIVFLAPTSAEAFGAAGFIPANAAVGRNLQTSAAIALEEPAPKAGFEITLTSDDPSRLLLSKTPDAAGAASIRLSVKEQFRSSPEFWLSGLGDSGSVTYTAMAPGFESRKGTVTLTPSAIVIVGPFKGPKFVTTPRADSSRLTIYPVRLDASLKYAEQQLIAGGLSVKVNVTSSNVGAGKVDPSFVTLTDGNPNGILEFKPGGAGETRLAPGVPTGFSIPAEDAEVTAVVRAPGVALTDEITIGQNLQLGAMVGLGEAATGDVAVTLTADDPERLLLSGTGKEAGSGSITIKIPRGSVNARFYLQALGKSGTTTYTASVPGYTSRTASVLLAPSGVVITPSAYGPPDEAELHRKEGEGEPHGFVSSLSKAEKMPLLVWTVQLDPVTLRSADITVQPLRAGMSLTVDVKSSDPAVGSINSPVTINGGSEHGGTAFTPLGLGSTVVSAVTPPGFTTSSNSSSVRALVQK